MGMTTRRILFRLLWPLVFVLPLWVLLGRAFFGAPLGLQFVGQVLLVPLLFAGHVVAAGLIVARRSVRSSRAVSWLDAGLLVAAWLAQLALGFFLVDRSSGAGAASGFTAATGGDLDLSTALSALASVLTIASVIALVVSGGWQLLRETGRRVAASMAELDRVAGIGVAQAGARRPSTPWPDAASSGSARGDGPVIRIETRTDDGPRRP
ncbi:hypothetical protein ASF89_09905 [Frigoribacterium sp. Leaf172]|nr:hypothetical protein ASF89_09905 [Frigoribacterium sp. Leaf172]